MFFLKPTITVILIDRNSYIPTKVFKQLRYNRLSEFKNKADLKFYFYFFQQSSIQKTVFANTRQTSYKTFYLLEAVTYNDVGATQ